MTPTEINVFSVDKRMWRTYIQSPKYPHHLRWLRGTLLMLLPLVATEGALTAKRSTMCEATGLSARTLGWHLARAVEEGLLVRTMHGGRHHKAVYQVSVPVSVSV